MAKAKFDIKSEAQRGLHAYVGAADLALEAIKEYAATAQKRFEGVQQSVTSMDFEPKALRDEVQTIVSENVENASETYDDLAKRGETVLRKFRNKPATKRTVSSAKTTVAKAKTTRTQATKAAKTAQGPKAPSKKKTATARSSAKATGTAARKTVSNAAKAVS